MKKTATRADVARAAGVSVASVSRAVNNSGYIKKDTKERILEIAKNMGYNPNPIALSLQSQKTRQLILYQNDIITSYNLQFFNGATRAAYKRGYSIFLDINCEFDKIRRHLVDGVIFSLEALAEKYINTVGVNYYLPVVVTSNDASFSFAHPVHNVLIDNHKVVNMGIDYLMNKGHRKIGMVLQDKGKNSEIRYRIWKTRMEQYKRDSGINIDLDELVIRAEISNSENMHIGHLDPTLRLQSSDDNYTNYASFSIGKRAAEIYLKSNTSATALLCFNDDIAYGFIRGVEKNGVRVPEDISVMGIDGIYLREWLEKKITTVSIDPENLGTLSTNVMIDILEDKNPKYINWTSPKILEGETVKDITVR
ncbi:LacI family DNA-binding transcriptional regulator [Lachnospiraceae bacterium MD1]|jgi:DNA-binding LacI/PurR family transcriptional regulator|uniref:LacI family DNA-binding transcriptional regulator n=1 Tax=Variimorphobacter saccharofermentans TaxID=2755051 RepID=A0A839K2E3_9FIRM|nr:LacI family DNA-binding transcriptional regulator [Variimorphobacter saccharofermentans]MBB2183974.1 LacI family DNA-binding transcriptional regulator [Variimorphobacter saccharofermentans]